MISADAIDKLPDMPQLPDNADDPKAMMQFQQEMQKWSLIMNMMTKALETRHQAQSAAVNRANANIR